MSIKMSPQFAAAILFAAQHLWQGQAQPTVNIPVLAKSLSTDPEVLRGFLLQLETEGYISFVGVWRFQLLKLPPSPRTPLTAAEAMVRGWIANGTPPTELGLRMLLDQLKKTAEAL